MKNRIEKKRRIEASLKENRGGGNSLIQGYPISPSITINVIRETEGKKKRKKKRGDRGEVVRRRFRFDRSRLFPAAMALLLKGSDTRRAKGHV